MGGDGSVTTGSKETIFLHFVVGKTEAFVMVRIRPSGACCSPWRVMLQLHGKMEWTRAEWCDIFRSCVVMEPADYEID